MISPMIRRSRTVSSRPADQTKRRRWPERALNHLHAHWGLAFAVVTSVSVVAAFLLTSRGIGGWDEAAQMHHSLWLLGRYGLAEAIPPYHDPTVAYYGTLWDLILGIASEFPFRFLRDPLWVRLALNTALYPVTLFLTYALLVRAKVGRVTALLAIACLFSLIRFGGHGFVNTKDFPAAAACLIGIIFLWTALGQIHSDAQHGRLRVRTLAAAGAVSVLPFLLRPPLVHLFAGLLLFLIGYALLAARTLSPARRCLLPLIPLASGLALVLALYPPYWTLDPGEWMKPFTLFSNYPLPVYTRVFGMDLHAPVPWWYPLLWIPIGITPFAFAACVGGTVAGLLPHARSPFVLALDTRWGRIDLTLRRWVWLVALCTWAAVLIAHPHVLYNDERHVLFLYPPLILAAALGLDVLRDSWKRLLTAVLVVTALASYGRWREYSYVYRSPLIGSTSNTRFAGDYWGLCLNEAMRALPRYVSPDTPFSVSIRPVAEQQLKRLQESLFGRVAGMERYRLADFDRSRTHVHIANRENSSFAEFQEDLRGGKATILWQSTMPPGEPSCLMLLYPGRS